MIDAIEKAIEPMSSPVVIPTEARAAAVLLPLIFSEQSKQWEVIFTRRAKHLKHHPGQISFPGGGFEETDIDLSHTALRETHEEIGIAPEKIQLLGHLPQHKTVSLYKVTPFVGIVESNPKHRPENLIIDRNEVAETFSLPLNFLIDSNNQTIEHKTENNTQYTYPVIYYQPYKIWGTTAKILVDLTNQLKA